MSPASPMDADLLDAALGDDGVESVEAVVGSRTRSAGARVAASSVKPSKSSEEGTVTRSRVPRLCSAVPRSGGHLGREDIVQQIVGAAFFLIQLGECAR